MIEELGIRYIPREERRKIKGYTKYDDCLTYHHIKEKHKGGQATLQNGALVRGYNHRWLHSLAEEDKQKVNNAIIEFKAAILQCDGQGRLVPTGEKVSTTLNFDIDLSDCIEIPVFETTKEDMEKRKKFNRAKAKREFKQKMEEDLDIYYSMLEEDEER